MDDNVYLTRLSGRIKRWVYAPYPMLGSQQIIASFLLPSPEENRGLTNRLFSERRAGGTKKEQAGKVGKHSLKSWLRVEILCGY